MEGVSATVDDKLRIAEQLDHLGVHFIEGGWPGANPKDIEFFQRAAHELQLSTSTMVAFGSTRRPKGRSDDDATLRNLLDAGTSAVCIVAKSWDYHVLEALQTTLDEGEAMIADSVRFLTGAGRRVLVDMEHFFDGFKRNPEFALRALEAAVVNGATHVVLCDTNGGSLPHEVEQIVGDVHRHVGSDVIIGIHCHDDTGCAVANSMAAVRGGARHVQGTLNGLGERTGNCNLTTVIPNLELKLGLRCLPEGRLERLTSVSHHVAEVLNRPLNPQAPYVGASAFAHKAGLHVSAIKRAKDAYEHVDPGAGRQRHALRRQRDGRPGDDPDQGRGARPAARRPGDQRGDRRPQAPRARGLPLRGGRCVARAAHAPRRRLGAGAVPHREHAGDHRRARRNGVHHRGDGEGLGARQRRRRAAPRAHRRGQRSGQRDRLGACAPRCAAPIRSSTAST